MARRPIEKELYKTLKENELDFIPRGIYHLEDIYDFIKNEYPHRCDDNYLCIQHCRGGKNAPEWKHTVRSFLETLKKTDKILKLPERFFWELR
jgi:hypothetical protein